MSGGGRKGEIRIRKARPVAKTAGGTHNRKARRAAKAQGALFTEPDTETQRLRALWEAFGRHHERTRPEREARAAAFTTEQYDSENQTLPPSHINLTELLRRVEREHLRLRDIPFETRQREAFEVAEILQEQAGAHLVDQDVVIPVTSKKGREENDLAGDTLARALAIGSLQPGGVKLWSMWFESVDRELTTRFLVDPKAPWLEVTEEASTCM